MKFKVGDIVMCIIGKETDTKNNHLYKVITSRSHTALVGVEMVEVLGINYNFSSSRFKLVKPNKLNKKLYPEILELLDEI